MLLMLANHAKKQYDYYVHPPESLGEPWVVSCHPPSARPSRLTPKHRMQQRSSSERCLSKTLRNPSPRHGIAASAKPPSVPLLIPELSTHGRGCFIYILSAATRFCSVVSRSRIVTVPSSSVSKSITTQYGVPISSWRR